VIGQRNAFSNVGDDWKGLNGVRFHEFAPLTYESLLFIFNAEGDFQQCLNAGRSRRQNCSPYPGDIDKTLVILTGADSQILEAGLTQLANDGVSSVFRRSPECICDATHFGIQRGAVSDNFEQLFQIKKYFATGEAKEGKMSRERKCGSLINE